jgi:hypothetical protein
VHPATRLFFVLFGLVVLVPTLGWGTMSVANSLGHSTETTALSFGRGLRSVVVRVGTGRVTVRGGDRDDIVGERTVERSLQAPTIDERVDGSTLRLEGSCPNVAMIWCEVSYVLDVPHGTTVDIESGSGSMSVSAIDGDVRADSGAGSIELNRIGGRITADSGAGSIRATELRSTTTSATSGAGSVRLQFLEAPTLVTAHAGAGSVDIEVPHGDESNRVTNTRGSAFRGNHDSVAVAVDSESARRIEVDSGAGSVRVHYP